ncbi:MAG: microcin C transport system substrate-binding protein [Alphaproteobacteria bacterium]|nr:microcin C transport system substrate-binding protein [Alphaproteobacteria bacterium]
MRALLWNSGSPRRCAARDDARRALKNIVLVLLFLFTLPAHAVPSHGLSAFGDLKYPENFAHFSYVNPDAPQGGTLSMIGSSGTTSFDSLNAFILKGQPAEGLELLFDSLMVRAQDEPDAMYGLLAQSADIADDRQSVIFHLRPEARFHDATPVTAEDVVFSFDTLKKHGHPFISLPLRDVARAEALDAQTVRFVFSGSETRDLPLVVAQLPILSKAYYKAHDFTATAMEPPLGSGPYRVKDAQPGRAITYARNADYWGWNLPVNRGRYNFAIIRYDFFRDRPVAFEAFKANAYDLREEFTSKTWATEYDFPARRDGRVVRATLPDENPSGVQGFFINLRRGKFSDIRVRQALDLAFDFEWANRNLFFGLYDRTDSYFENSSLAASGLPDAAELALLEPHRGKLPAAAFARAYTPPVTNGTGNLREELIKAGALLDAAGWRVKDGKRVNAKGEPLSIEFLNYEAAFERIISPYLRNLKRLGIDARLRTVDPSQYEARIEAFDFDITTSRYVQRNTPGIELRGYFSSAAAAQPGSRNIAGISDPVVDALIEAVIAAKDRAALTAASRALDRVLRSQHYWVPQWFKGVHTIAYWDRFGRPPAVPKYDTGIIDTWWVDPAKAARIESGKAN